MVGITFFFFLLIGFVFLALVVAAVADWLFDLTNASRPRDGSSSSVRREPPDRYAHADASGGIGGTIDAGAASFFGGCDPGAGAMGGCDGGGAGGDGGC